MNTSCKTNFDTKYLPVLGRIFTPLVLDSLAVKGHSPFLSELCINTGLLEKIDTSKTLGQFFDWAYNILLRDYRNEYIYKNVIANKILLGKYSLNTTHMLTEFRVGKCKADVVLLNGTSTVYEIKSEFDSFSRLERQMRTYFEIFDYINVITSPSQVNSLGSILPDEAGILVLSDRNTISTIRKPISNKEHINLGVLFDSLRKKEYIKIIENYYGEIPDVPNTRIYRECRKIFCKIPSTYAHDLSINTLKLRNNAKILKDFIDKAPSSLTAYAISISKDKNKMHKLAARFEMSLYSILNTEAK